MNDSAALPALLVDVSSDGVRVPLSRARIAALARAVLHAERARAAEISIAFVSAAHIARLNWTYLRHRGPTDIVTFELPRTADGAVAGDIYIAPEIARANARRHGCGVREEIARLVVHGVLHAMGHEHPEDEARTSSPMWRRQERLLARYRALHAGSHPVSPAPVAP